MSLHPETTLENDLKTVLFDRESIQRRVRELGREISTLYKGHELTVIAITNGAIVFTADLIRELDLAIRLDCIHVSSYKQQMSPAQSPEIIKHIRLNIKDTNILLIDDILDTGNTLSDVSKRLWSMQPASLRTCVLLDKKARRSLDIEADFVGFEIPDEFVVGYGLDYAESYRQLPYIGILNLKQ